MTLYFLPELFYRYGSSDTDLEYLLLFLRSQEGFSPRVPLDLPTRRKMLQLLAQVAEELKAQTSSHRIAIKNCLCQILLVLNRAAGLQKLTADPPRLRMRNISRLKPVFDFIHEQYCRKMALPEISAASNMSVSNLRRYFKKVTGQTITEYIKRYRVDRAKELLIEDEKSITWIAYEVGFESHSYFDRIFHEVTHLTPQQFRRKFAPRLPIPGTLARVHPTPVPGHSHSLAITSSGSHHPPASTPPSTTRVVPVIYDDAGAASSSTAPTISSGCAGLRTGMRLRIQFDL